MFYHDAREININRLNSKLPKGLDSISIGDEVILSHNMSTGDRSYSDVICTVVGRNHSGSHAKLEFFDKYSSKNEIKSTIVQCSEYEFYSTHGLCSKELVTTDAKKGSK